MLTLFKLFWSRIWSKIPIASKITIIVIIVAFFGITYYAGQYTYYKFKYLEEKLETVTVKRVENSTKTKKAVKKGIKNNRKAKQKAKQIDNKLEQDENAIDNHNDTDDELIEFISGYKK